MDSTHSLVWVRVILESAGYFGKKIFSGDTAGYFRVWVVIGSLRFVILFQFWSGWLTVTKAFLPIPPVASVSLRNEECVEGRVTQRDLWTALADLFCSLDAIPPAPTSTKRMPGR